METEKSHINILLILLGIFATLWWGLVKFLQSLKLNMWMSYTQGKEIFPIIIGVLSAFFMLYVLLIIRAIYYHTAYESTKLLDRRKLLCKKNEAYLVVLRRWPFYGIAFSIVCYFIFNYYISKSFLFGFGIALAVLISVPIWIGLIFGHLFKPQYHLDKLAKSFPSRIKKIPWKNFVWPCLGYLFFIIIYFHSITVFTMGVDVQFDKFAYYDDENVMVQVKPIGIFVPRVDKVTYSNEAIPLYADSNKPFSNSFKYLVIPSAILKTMPEDSFLTISYGYDLGGWMTNITSTDFFPVPIYVRPEPSDDSLLQEFESLSLNISDGAINLSNSSNISN